METCYIVWPKVVFQAGLLENPLRLAGLFSQKALTKSSSSELDSVLCILVLVGEQEGEQHTGVGTMHCDSQPWPSCPCVPSPNDSNPSLCMHDERVWGDGYRDGGLKGVGSSVRTAESSNAHRRRRRSSNSSNSKPWTKRPQIRSCVLYLHHVKETT